MWYDVHQLLLRTDTALSALLLCVLFQMAQDTITYF